MAFDVQPHILPAAVSDHQKSAGTKITCFSWFFGGVCLFREL